MPDLSSVHRWRRLVPEIGDNQTQPKPFFLEVAEGVTNARMAEFAAARKALAEAKDGKGKPLPNEELVPYMKAVVDGLVRMGSEPLSLNGKKIETVDDYLLICACSANFFLWFELAGTIDKMNSIPGGAELFWLRQSGSTPTTQDQPAAKGESPKVG